jgi:aspartyl-tRNA(Asn)/glutamyl-tRNA(Gln) amidotransferase subunit C
MSQAKITPEQVRHVARLSRLDLDEPHLHKLAGQLESILTYVAKLAQLDVGGVQPISHAVELHNVFRDDVVQSSLPLEQVLMNAPDTEGPFFKVPKVLGEEDSAG